MSLTTPVCVGTAPESQDAGHTRQLEEHLVELRSHHQLVSGFVDNLVPPAVRRALRAYCASVEELLEHLDGVYGGERRGQPAVRTVSAPDRYERERMGVRE